MRLTSELNVATETSPDFGKPYTDPEFPGREFHLPERLDLMVTGRCVLRCAGCWGPSHNSIKPEMSPADWQSIVDYVDTNNRSDRYSTNNFAGYRAKVCITGGEPLMYNGIEELARSFHENGVPTTLSTTGHDPDRKLPTILEYVQELGVPIDGHTPEFNAMWREGKLEDGGLSAALGALVLAQTEYPDVQLTLRTLIHAGNAESIPLIPELLERNRIEAKNIVWKFYKPNTSTGPRKGDNKLRIDQSVFDELADKIAKFEPRFEKLDLLVPHMPQPRLIINHDGSSYFLRPNDGGKSEDIHVGNILTDPEVVITRLNNYHLDFILFSSSRAQTMDYLRLHGIGGDTTT